LHCHSFRKAFGSFMPACTQLWQRHAAKGSARLARERRFRHRSWPEVERRGLRLRCREGVTGN